MHTYVYIWKEKEKDKERERERERARERGRGLDGLGQTFGKRALSEVLGSESESAKSRGLEILNKDFRHVCTKDPHVDVFVELGHLLFFGLPRVRAFYGDSSRAGDDVVWGNHGLLVAKPFQAAQDLRL